LEDSIGLLYDRSPISVNLAYGFIYLRYYYFSVWFGNSVYQLCIDSR